jgi:hypothetical protein
LKYAELSPQLGLKSTELEVKDKSLRGVS